MADVEAETIILQGTFAARPAAAAALSYYVTTGTNAGKRYWSDGATWFEQPPTVETHVHAGADITSGTVADARVDAAIARDAEVTTAVSTHAGLSDPHTVYQLESGLAAAITATKLDDFTAPDDNTDLNASTTKHGLMPKGTGSTTTFFRSDMTQATPAGGGALAFGAASVATDETSTTASYIDLATSGPAVTITVNTKAKVTLTADIYGSAAGCTGRMSFAASGANTIAADDTRALCFACYDGTNANDSHSRIVLLTGLTPGSTVFTAKYKRGVTGTIHFRYRDLLVECMD